MKPWISRLSSLLLILSSSNLQAEPSLWLAEQGQKKLYLFGSIHLGTEDFYPLPATFIDAFKQSQRLIIETDVTNISLQDQQALKAHSQQPEQRFLSQDLSPKYQQLLAKRSQQLGISAAMFDNMQAWYVAIILSQLQMQSLDFEPQLGLDLHFIERAEASKTPIVELESFQQQIDALSSLASIQVPLLEQTLEDFEQVPALFKQLVNHWNNGDNQQLFALLSDDPMFQHDADMVLDKILFARNRAWMKQLTQFEATSFVVVGAMHLYGEQGLLSSLTQQGYLIREVDPMTN